MRHSLNIAPDRRVLVAGSTHEGEETLLKDAFLRLKDSYPDLCFISVPRDPGRAGGVRRLFASAGIAARTLATLEASPDKNFDVLVIDRIGLLKNLYSLGDLAFVGGSLVNRGGHNPLEPAAMAVPVLFGPCMDDFKEIAALLVETGGALTVTDGRQLTKTLRALLGDKARRTAMGRAAHDAVITNQGAVDRTVALIDGVAAS